MITPRTIQHKDGVLMTKPIDNQSLKIDRIVREKERANLTSISRSQAWKLEQKNLYPKRVHLSGNRSVGWKLSELIEWVANRPRVDSSEISKEEHK